MASRRTKTRYMLPTQANELLKSLELDSNYVFAFDGMRRDNVSTHIADAIKKNHIGTGCNKS